MKFPDFIIAGEAKAGTTVLHSYLTQHPEIFMSNNKEPRYFGFHGVRPCFSGPMDEEWFNQTTVYEQKSYYGLFAQAEEGKKVGEASPIYIHLPGCANAIASELPNVKIIVLIRNPVEVAFSAYQHMIRNGYEPLSFEEALKEEPNRIKQNWAWHWRYSQLGFVASNISQLLSRFPREQLLFINYDRFKNDNALVLKEICMFLDISSEFNFQKTRSNFAATPWLPCISRIAMSDNHWVRRFIRIFLPEKIIVKVITYLNKYNLTKGKLKIEKNLASNLLKIYEDDILETQELTKLKLDNWLLNHEILS